MAERRPRPIAWEGGGAPRPPATWDLRTTAKPIRNDDVLATVMQRALVQALRTAAPAQVPTAQDPTGWKRVRRTITSWRRGQPVPDDEWGVALYAALDEARARGDCL